MFTICLKEFSRSFNSIRSVIIIATIFGITIGIARLVHSFKGQLEEFGLGGEAYTGGLIILLLLVGPLFVTSLSHNVLNKEVESRTIRFIVTKTPRRNVVIGKFLGMILFWFICLFIAFLLLIPYTKAFYFQEFMESFIFIAYFVGLFLFLSTLINRSSMTMFVGVMLAMALPVIGLWSIGTENVFIKAISYVTPYFYYSQDSAFYPYLVAVFPLLFITLSLLIFRKKDL